MADADEPTVDDNTVDDIIEEDDGLDRTEQSFVSHLKELRSRIMKTLLCVLVVLLALMPFSNELYLWLAEPLLHHMAETGATMIATEVASPFLAPFKLSLFVAVFISIPYIFYQAWAFVAPGLYQKRTATPRCRYSFRAPCCSTSGSHSPITSSSRSCSGFLRR